MVLVGYRFDNIVYFNACAIQGSVLKIRIHQVMKDNLHKHLIDVIVLVGDIIVLLLIFLPLPRRLLR